MKNIIMYGAGNELDIYFANAPQMDFSVEAVVDSYKEGQDFWGYAIQDKNILKGITEDTRVVISSRDYFDEIREEILSLNPMANCISLDDLADTLPCRGYCNVCGSHIKLWRFCGNAVDTKYKITGNGRRIGSCPVCNSLDRNRWVYYVLKNETRLFEDGGTVLHFAPEEQIEKELRKNAGINYYTADIREGAADYVVDMTRMPFKDREFDYIIANHVLEHIPDEKKAIMELRRCIKRNGTIILSFPVTFDADTVEISGLPEEEKIKYYGQEDHVRLYGRDFKERLESYGLTVQILRPYEVLSKEAIDRIKVLNDDMAMVCSLR